MAGEETVFVLLRTADQCHPSKTQLQTTSDAFMEGSLSVNYSLMKFTGKEKLFMASLFFILYCQRPELCQFIVLWQTKTFIGLINQMSYRHWLLKVPSQTVVLSTMRLNYDRKRDFILYLLTDIWNLCSSNSSQTPTLPTLEITGNSSSDSNSKQ